jgi:hypothetical protein
VGIMVRTLEAVPMTDDRHVRIVFLLQTNRPSAPERERLWAEPVGDAFRISNSPFFAFNVSLGDVVHAKAVEGDLMFDKVASRGGHSTYRVHVKDPSRWDEFWRPIERHGCSFERGPVLAIDVPTAADIYDVYKLLERGKMCDVWDLEEAHCGHRLQDTTPVTNVQTLKAREARLSTDVWVWVAAAIATGLGLFLLLKSVGGGRAIR